MQGISQTEAAYMAGLIDGEGTITIRCHLQHLRNTYMMRAAVYVSNNDLKMIEWIKLRFGGSVVTQQPRNPLRNKTSYRWSVLGKQNVLPTSCFPATMGPSRTLLSLF